MKSRRYLYNSIALFLILVAFAQATAAKAQTPGSRIRIVVETLQGTNRWYHVRFPAGLTEARYYYSADVPRISEVFSDGRPSKLARRIGADIRRQAGREIVYLAISKYQIVVQVKSPKTWRRLDPEIIRILSVRLHSQAVVASREQQPSFMFDDSNVSSWQGNRLRGYIYGGDDDGLGYGVHHDGRDDVYLAEITCRYRIDHDLRLGNAPDAYCDSSGWDYTEQARAKGTVSEWILTRTLKVPGVESAGVLYGSFYAWIDKAFSKEDADKSIAQIVREAQAKFGHAP